MMKPGFIAPPWPHIRGDSVSVESLIFRIEKEAHNGCGLYYEIYHYRALCKLRDLYINLSASDAETFKDVAARHGFFLDDDALKECTDEYYKTITEIREEQK
ncbi:hypothetical protein D2B06_24485 [Salmonella enterica]|nr:hypothetical protein [Salmonella enterica]